MAGLWLYKIIMNRVCCLKPNEKSFEGLVGPERHMSYLSQESFKIMISKNSHFYAPELAIRLEG